MILLATKRTVRICPAGPPVLISPMFSMAQPVSWEISPTPVTAVQMHLIDRQIAGEDSEDWFAQLVVDAATGAPCKRVALRLLGESRHTHGMLFEIAEKLLEPLAHDALIAQAEDNEL